MSQEKKQVGNSSRIHERKFYLELGVLFSVSMSLASFGCKESSSPPEEGELLVTQTLLSEDFENGWPTSFTKPSCATEEARYVEAEYDPGATYSQNDKVCRAGSLYFCINSSSCNNTPPGEGNWSQAWNSGGSCTVDGNTAKLTRSCTIESTQPISTVGFQNLAVSYEYRTSNYGQGDEFAIYYSADGNEWELGQNHTSHYQWETVELPLPAALRNSGVHLRIVATSDADATSAFPEAAFMDNILVSGEAPQGCVPAEMCEFASAECGVYDDPNCGEIDCGSCASGEICGNNKCAADCSAEAVCGSSECGIVDTEACGEVLCGSCDATELCVDGGCYDECSQVAVCSARGAECGELTDPACGTDVDCGGCGDGFGCVDNLCEACDGGSCEELGVACGKVKNSCGGTLNCGLCEAGDVCDSDAQCVADDCVDCGPLDSQDLNDLALYLSCKEGCSFGRASDFESCMADACGSSQQRWDKDRDGDVDDRDFELASLESDDPDSICIENGAVVPIAACGLADCVGTRTDAGSSTPEQDCEDKDQDGLLSFQEDLLGSSDDPFVDDMHFECGVDAACTSFNEKCAFSPLVNQYVCQLREACDCSHPFSDCGGRSSGEFGGNCTAFHLSEVAQDGDEVIVRVHYDYSPAPATVMDLNITYNDSVLVLADARPVGELLAAGKDLETRPASDGKVRLTIVDTGSSRPVPQGVLAELYFVRQGSSASSIGFSLSDFDQKWSLAPDQGAATEDLAVDELWGNPAGDDPDILQENVRSVAVYPGGPSSDRILLHYSFDNPQFPLDINRAPSGNELCEWSPAPSDVGGCMDAIDAQASSEDRHRAERAATVARFDALQRGVVQRAESIDGVSGPAVFLDGVSAHLEMPLTLSRITEGNDSDPLIDPAEQSITAAFWFYSEGDGTAGMRQVLFSHHVPSSEKPQFALVLNPLGNADGDFDLEWIRGGSINTSETSNVDKLNSSALPKLTWHHVALAFDAEAETVTFVLNGSEIAQLEVSGSPLACPQSKFPNPGLLVPEDGQSGPAPERIYFTSAENSLFGIESIEPTGLARQEIRRTGIDSSRDVHYSPLSDKLIFSSTKTGDSEIWIANGDGSEPRQVTFGFGDTERRIFARRPRWSPTGEGIVFESNIYSTAKDDNKEERVFRIFYLPFNPFIGEFEIPSGIGESATKLTSIEYETAVDTIGRYVMTDGDSNATNAQFAIGVSAELVGRGEVWFTKSNPDFSDPQAARLTIGDDWEGGTSCAIDLMGDPPECAGDNAPTNVRLLAAGSVDPAGGDREHFRLIEERFVSYLEPEGVSLQMEPVNGADGAVYEVVVTYQGMPVDESGSCLVADCEPVALTGMVLTIPSELEVIRDIDRAVVDYSAQAGGDTPLVIQDKRLKVRANPEGTRLRIDVLSDTNVTPIEADTLLSTFRFKLADPSAGAVGPFDDADFSLTKEKIDQQLYYQFEGANSEYELFDVPGLEQVTAAAFNQTGTHLVLAGFENARPVLVTVPVHVADGQQRPIRKLNDEAVDVETVQWVSVNRAFPCNWMGAYRDPIDRIYHYGFKGGLDEVKLYNYARSSASLRSEVERDQERYNKEVAAGETQPPVSSATPCDTALDCPSYQVCQSGQCVFDDCQSDDDCGEGTCKLLASSKVSGGAEGRRVCTVDCSIDDQCFSQQCLNGPCRFCDAGSCLECRTVDREIAADTFVREVEGCPDRNSFACEAGSCVTECYAFENEQTKYLCDPALERCELGRCRLIDWDWSDLAPATFSGLNEMLLDQGAMADRTVSVSQNYAVTIRAEGSPDYGLAPRVLVQGRVSHSDSGPYGATTLFGGAWFDVGEVVIHAPPGKPANYTLTTPYPLSHLRLLLVQPPFFNPNLGSTGRGGLGGHEKYCDTYGSEACNSKAVGSRQQIGYDVGKLPASYLCAGEDSCSSVDASGNWVISPYLLPGAQAVQVHDVKVEGNAVVKAAHRICGYRDDDGTVSDGPWDSASASRRPLAFGTLVNGPAEMVLNCSYAPAGADANSPDPNASEIAGLWFGPILSTIYTHPGDPEVKAGRISEAGGSCLWVAGPGDQKECYEWQSDANIDYFITEDVQLYQTLELQNFTSFGYEE